MCEIYVHDIKNKNLDDNFCSLFLLTKNRHDISTRQATSDLFVQPEETTEALLI